MSLIFEDLGKYKNIKDKFQKEDEATLENTLAQIRNMSDTEMTDFLDSLGRFFRHIRINNKVTLRSFCEKYDLSSIVISEVERGLRLPNLDLMDIYLRDDIKEKNEEKQDSVEDALIAHLPK